MASRIAALALAVLALVLAAGWPRPAELRQPFLAQGDAVVDEVDGAAPCRVSYDGFIWYEVGPGSFPPTAIRHSECPAGSRLRAQPDAIIPAWAKPHGQTKALFVATSFHEIPSRIGMMRIAELAHAYGIPVTWMTGQPTTFEVAGDLYDSYHRRFGDDLQTRPTNHNPNAIASPTPTHFATLAAQRFRWFRPAVAIEGVGYERDIAADMADGYRAFWGIAWNSHGLDNDYDEGTPWGAYCADTQSYRRPSGNVHCNLVGLEWTARDLTRTAISDHEEFYSTDPDDLQVAGFDRRDGAQYMRELVDAYAAAGELQPIVMVSQQETDQMERAPFWSDISTSSALLDALYSQAKADGMRTVTLAQAAGEARRFADRPTAIAFPYLASSAVPEAWSPWSYRGPYPATIDYRDPIAGMSFIQGRTTPVRVFPFDRASHYSTFLTLPRLQTSEMPALTAAAYRDGTLTLIFQSPVSTEYGVALWSDPAKVRWTSAHAIITSAGRAGVVAVFDLPRGRSTLVLNCTGCSSTTFPLAP
jgi:hypothetical protein